MNVKLLILLILTIMFSNCSKVEKLGIKNNLNGLDRINSLKYDTTNKRLLLKTFTNFDINQNFNILLRFDTSVIYNDKFQNNKLTSVYIPLRYMNKYVTGNILFYKKGNDIGYYFEPITQFYLHENDNVIIINLDCNKEYPELFFIGTQNILGL